MKNNLNLVERTFVTQNMFPKIDNSLSTQIFYRKNTISESPDEETPPVVTLYDSPKDKTPIEEDEVIIVTEKKSEGLQPALDQPTPASSKHGFADYYAKKKGEDRQCQPHPGRVSFSNVTEIQDSRRSAFPWLRPDLSSSMDPTLP